MRKLPVRLHEKHGAFYYVYRNKWTLLSRNYAEALQLYGGMIVPKTGGMPELIARWFADKRVAKSTRKTYKAIVESLKVAFEEFEPQDVKPAHLYQFLTAKGISESMSGHYRSVLVGVMQLAVEQGLVDQNLIREVRQFSTPRRTRYINDKEYQAVYQKATPTLRAIMTICVMTGQRIGDILNIRYSDLTEDGIVFEQQKTGNRLCVGWTPELKEAVSAAKSLHTSVKGMTLFHTRQGTRFSYSTIRTLWDRATGYAKVENAHLHDLRAKAATDARKQGIDSKGLLGHKSDSSHAGYLRSKETPIVQPVKIKKS